MAVISKSRVQIADLNREKFFAILAFHENPVEI